MDGGEIDWRAKWKSRARGTDEERVGERRGLLVSLLVVCVYMKRAVWRYDFDIELQGQLEFYLAMANGINYSL